MSQSTPPDDKPFEISRGAALAHGCCGGLGASRLPKFAIGLNPSEPDSCAEKAGIPADTAEPPTADKD